MRVLVDTCIWSEVLRYEKSNKALISKFEDVIEDGRVVIIGPIKQELLSGVSSFEHFEKLKKVLSAFPDILLRKDHFEKAAEYCHVCRQKGTQGSTIDFLMCAVSSIEKLHIYTIDKDFERYQKYLPIKLFK